MNRESLEARAEKTLRDTDTFRVPVAIDRVAQRLNLAMEAGALGDNVSGMLMIRGDRGAIGYNSAHAWVRQRFAIAHEIAHFLLHARRAGKPQLFIDGSISFRRDATSSTRAERDEVEASQLGAALLMPRSLIKQELLSNDLNLDDEESIDSFAKRFQVGTPAMANRLLKLKLLLL